MRRPAPDGPASPAGRVERSAEAGRSHRVVCIRDRVGDRVATRREVDEQARRFAAGLAGFGVGAGDRVVILMRNDIAFEEATFGIMMVGAYAVPLNWHFKPDEIAYVLRDSGAKALVGHTDLLHGASPVVPSGLPVVSVPPPGGGGPPDLTGATR